MVGRRIRDRKVAGSPPVYALPRDNLGQVVYMHVPLSTKQYKLVPASAGTKCTTGAVLVGWQPIGRRCS